METRKQSDTLFLRRSIKIFGELYDCLETRSNKALNTQKLRSDYGKTNEASLF